MSLKKDIDLADAGEVALDFLSRTKDLYRKVLLAGSIRRKEPVVHDIVLAVFP